MRTLRISIISYLFTSLVEFFEPHRKDNCHCKDIQCQTSESKEKEAEKSYNELLDLMEEEKPYLDNGLNKDTLSYKLKVRPERLKEIINQKAGSTVFQFINTYRLDELKKKLSASENNTSTILSLAYESGFKSKSSFYKTFKKLTGITPSKYLGKAA